ncbi:hypothetical protein LTR56_008281 [Elasticomyces elasticus]|nr:hypothetical protein LTR56_008281 [Elasticomyces elasticus]KAK3661844.1 hypothetical protein LTR22_007427 [Elasticomyces elasticus]KAK4924448.1 hypothetical protein LTR49_008539 [Elasticomyces elasticus]KAK5762587.1 hypothetical protein LTS12_007177 [Elasticomyces elasticus]
MSRIWASLLTGATFFLYFTDALIITSPAAGENVSLAKPFFITWNEEAGDAAAVSIDLLNATALNPSPILENIAHNLNTSSGKVNVTWPLSVPNDTATYQLYFIATESGDDIANSGYFNLTLPVGENRSEAAGTVGPYGTHPDSDTAPSTPIHHGLSGGAIAGIVVGVLVFIGLCGFGGTLILRGRRRRRAGVDEETKNEKPELDASSTSRHKRNKTIDTIASTELDAYDDDKKDRIDSGELEGDTRDYLRYELPSTPPLVELADNEVAAAEMPSPDLNDEKISSAKIGDWHLRQPIPQHAESIRSGRTSDVLSVRSGSTAFGGRELSFAEALHDIVSLELRRNE